MRTRSVFSYSAIWKAKTSFQNDSTNAQSFGVECQSAAVGYENLAFRARKNKNVFLTRSKLAAVNATTSAFHAA